MVTLLICEQIQIKALGQKKYDIDQIKLALNVV